MRSEPDTLRVKQIFEKAIDLTSTSERQGYVNSTCNGDAALLARVQTLLRAHFENGNSFLPENPAGVFTPRDDAGAEERIGDVIGSPTNPSSVQSSVALAKEEALAKAEAKGRSTMGLPAVALAKAGRYKLLQKIGEGGCGVVWMAEQVEPVRRRVALKLIRLGMDTREFIARFEAERQALALMDHPSIAQVFDAGATDSGRPYLVLELIRGTPITKYCDENRLPLRARLELFIRVCGAVQHAHQKGVIHRDLKPSNILVMVVNGEPLPKVIDFGIAKAIAAPLTEKTVCTRIDTLIGTPAYSSPEQMEIGLRDVDTRTDVYSLGVLLYELLTGCPPFDRAELQGATFDEMRRTIREVEPPRPSLRVANLIQEERTEIAARRAADPRQFPVLLRSDLDWIVMRCLEKDRARRYETANALAMDIRRHLENEPVVARPPSSAYRLGKLMRRYRTTVITVAAVVISLAGGLIATGIALRHEKAARERAVAAERAQSLLRRQADAAAQQARDAAETSRQVAQVLKDMLGGVGPSVARGRDTTLLREMLDDTIPRIDTDLHGQPEVAANLRHTLGIALREIGEYDRATALWREAIAAWRALGERKSADLAATLHELGSLLARINHVAESEIVLAEALAIRERTLGPDHFDVGTTLAAIAGNQGSHRTAREREAMARRAVAIQRKHPGRDDDEFARTLTVLGYILHYNLRLLDEAESLLREGVEIRRRMPGSGSVGIADSYSLLARVAFGGRRDEAQELAWRRRQLSIVREMRGPANARLVGALLGFASCRFPAETFADDLQVARSVFAELAKVLPGDSPDLAVAQLALASMIGLAPGKSAEGESLASDAVARIRRAREAGVLPHRDTSTAMQLFAWRTHVGNRLRYALPMAEELNADSNFGSVLSFGPPAPRTLGRIYFDLGRYKEAIPLLEATSRGELSVRRTTSSWPQRENLLTDSAFAGYAYRKLGRLGDSRQILEWALTRRIGSEGETDPAQSSRVAVRGELGFTAMAESDLAEAEALLRTALEEYAKVTSKDAPPGIQWIEHFPHGRILSGLGQVLAKQGRLAEAEPLLVKGYSDMIAQRQRLWGNPTAMLREALDAVIAFYREAGNLEKAAEWEAEVGRSLDR